MKASSSTLSSLIRDLEGSQTAMSVPGVASLVAGIRAQAAGGIDPLTFLKGKFPDDVIQTMSVLRTGKITKFHPTTGPALAHLYSLIGSSPVDTAAIMKGLTGSFNLKRPDAERSIFETWLWVSFASLLSDKDVGPYLAPCEPLLAPYSDPAVAKEASSKWAYFRAGLELPKLDNVKADLVAMVNDARAIAAGAHGGKGATDPATKDISTKIEAALSKAAIPARFKDVFPKDPSDYIKTAANTLRTYLPHDLVKASRAGNLAIDDARTEAFTIAALDALVLVIGKASGDKATAMMAESKNKIQSIYPNWHTFQSLGLLRPSAGFLGTMKPERAADLFRRVFSRASEGIKQALASQGAAMAPNMAGLQQLLNPSVLANPAEVHQRLGIDIGPGYYVQASQMIRDASRSGGDPEQVAQAVVERIVSWSHFSSKGSWPTEMAPYKSTLSPEGLAEGAGGEDDEDNALLGQQQGREALEQRQEFMKSMSGQWLNPEVIALASATLNLLYKAYSAGGYGRY